VMERERLANRDWYGSRLMRSDSRDQRVEGSAVVPVVVRIRAVLLRMIDKLLFEDSAYRIIHRDAGRYKGDKQKNVKPDSRTMDSAQHNVPPLPLLPARRPMQSCKLTTTMRREADVQHEYRPRHNR